MRVAACGMARNKTGHGVETGGKVVVCPRLVAQIRNYRRQGRGVVGDELRFSVLTGCVVRLT